MIDVAGFVADVKSQAIDHGFHVHDERHFVETYSLRQLWEVDLHPEEACAGPIDLHLSLDVDPRAMLGFEDEVMKLDEIDDPPPTGFTFPLIFTWTLPPLPDPPDLLVLATDLAGIGGIDLPVEVSAIDSFPSVTDAPERSLSIVAKMTVDLADVYMNVDDAIEAALDRCKHVSLYLLERAPDLARRVLADIVVPPATATTPHGSAMRVHELIDILSDQPADAEVEFAVIAPVEEGSDDITVDRYFVDGVLPWEDDEPTTKDDGELTIWLVGGEEADVNAFLDAIEQPDV